MRALALVCGLIALAACLAPTGRSSLPAHRTYGTGLVAFNHRGAESWARAYRVEHRRFLAEQRHRLRVKARVQSLQRSLYHRNAGQVAGPFYAIRLASAVFGVPEAQMRAVASCETGGSFSPSAYNPSSASGLFQILTPSTWNRTPLRAFSPFDPIANSLAAGWIWRSDGGSFREWVCRP